MITDIPIGELKVGDHAEANVPLVSHPDQRTIYRVTIKEIVGNIIRVKAAARKGLIPILKSDLIKVWRGE